MSEFNDRAKEEMVHHHREYDYTMTLQQGKATHYEFMDQMVSTKTHNSPPKDTQTTKEVLQNIQKLHKNLRLARLKEEEERSHKSYNRQNFEV